MTDEQMEIIREHAKRKGPLFVLTGWKPPESTQKPWWWLSFADDDGFNGAVIVRADNEIDAFKSCKQMNLDPGGQVLVVLFPFDIEPPPIFVNRILTRQECEAFDAVMMP